MALTAAERARAYRARKKANLDTREQYLRKDKERKAAAYVSVGDRTKWDKRRTRSKWRNVQRASRSRKKELLAVQCALNTPPSTPNNNTAAERGRKKNPS